MSYANGSKYLFGLLEQVAYKEIILHKYGREILFKIMFGCANHLMRMVIFNALLCSTPLLAEDEVLADSEGADPETPKAAIYLPIKPQFVVNYGGGKRLKYLKAKVSVRLNSSPAADAVRHHLPYIRNNLVLLFAAQSDQSLSSQEGKEQMRLSALNGLRELLAQEDGIPEEDVVDVLFNSLTWH